MLNQQLGRYVLQGCIGDGGMGCVYKATDRETAEPVAIKILHAELAHDPEMVERFVREGQAARRIQHPGIIKILDSGLTDKGLPYLVMEYLQGQSLAAELRARGRLPLWEALRIAQELSAALAAAHAQQVVHRDLKPENIFRLTDVTAPSFSHVKLLDFGIALVATPSERKRLTRAGEILGTPCYMAPEVVLDPRTASERSDAYALGVIIYQMLVGEPPFTADCPSGVLFKQVSATPPPLKKGCSGAPPLLCALTQELLSKQPAARPTMIEVFQALLYIERTLPSATSLSKSRRGGLIRRSIAWIAPSLFVYAGAMALTRAPHHAPVGVQSQAPMTAQPLKTQPAPTAKSDAPFAAPEPPRWPGLPPLRMDTELATMPPPRPHPVAPSVAPSPPLPALASPDTKASSFAAARLAFTQGRYDQAISLSQNALREKPYDAWQLLGRAACKKGNVLLAKEALRRLDPNRQTLVRYDCGPLLND